MEKEMFFLEYNGVELHSRNPLRRSSFRFEERDWALKERKKAASQAIEVLNMLETGDVGQTLEWYNHRGRTLTVFVETGGRIKVFLPCIKVGSSFRCSYHLAREPLMRLRGILQGLYRFV